MKTPSPSKGLSLMELVVVMGMFFAALGLVQYIFSQTNYITKVGQERNQIDRSRITLANSIRRHLADSELSGNSGYYLNDDPDSLALSIISTRDVEGKKHWSEDKQRPIFQAYQVFYRDALDKTLKTHRIAKATPSTIAEPLSKADLASALQSLPGTVVTQAVRTFQLCSAESFEWSEVMCSPLGLKLVQDTDRGTPLLTQFSFSIALP